MKKFKLCFLALTAIMITSCGPTSQPTSDTQPTTPPSTEPSTLLDLTVSQSSYSLVVGETAKIEVAESGVTFTSSNTSIVTVSDLGEIYAVAKGTTDITLTKDGYNDSKVSVVVEAANIFEGKYVFNFESELIVSRYGISLDGVEFTDVSLESVESGKVAFDTILKGTYESTEYCLFYSEDPNNKGKYEINFGPNSGSYTPSYSIMPSIEEYRGSYTIDGSGDQYNVNYIVGLGVDGQNSRFNIGVFLPYDPILYTGSWFAKSYKTVFNNKLMTGFSIIDGENDVFYNFVGYEKNNQMVLYDLDYSQEFFFYDPSILRIKLIDEKLAEHQYGLNTTSKTAIDYSSENNEVYYYSMEYNSKYGQYITLTPKNNKSLPNKYIYIAPNGRYEIVEEQVTEHILAPDLTSYLNKTFCSKDHSITFYQENGEYFANDIENNAFIASYSIKNHQLVFSFKFSKEIIELTPYIDGKVFIKNDCTAHSAKENETLVEYEFLKTLFNHSYVNSSLEHTTLDNSFNVTPNLSGSKTKYYVSYDLNIKEYVATLYVKEQDSKVGEIKIVDFEKGIYLYNDTSNNETTPLFTKKAFENMCGEWTKDGVGKIKIESDFNKAEFLITVNDEKSEQAVPSIYYDADVQNQPHTQLFVFFEENESYSILNYGDTMLIEDQTGMYSYIPVEQYNKMVGTYSYKGPYGMESFYVTPGHFYADTLIGDQLIKTEYSFMLLMLPFGENVVPVLIFLAGSDASAANIYLYFVGPGKVLCFDTPYVEESLFDRHGIYTESSKKHIIHIYDDYFVINEEIYTYESHSETEEYSQYVAKNADSGQITLNFSKTDGSLTIDGHNSIGSSVVFNKDGFNLDDFVRTYRIDQSTTVKFEVKLNPLNNLKVGYKIMINNYEVNDYSITYYKGKLAIEVDIVFEQYYFYYSSGTPVCERVSNVPPPPPGL